MATVDEFRGMAHDFYARARASLDPSKKQKLVKSADAYLKQAEELRRGHVIVQRNGSPSASKSQKVRPPPISKKLLKRAGRGITSARRAATGKYVA